MTTDLDTTPFDRTFDRAFNAARQAQGFRSQEHLDAFYAAYDHKKTCALCQRPGPGAIVGDCWYPTVILCDEGQRLDAVEFSF